MATSKETIEFLRDALALVPEVTFRPMMGEYCVYSAGRVFGLVCDDVLFLKTTPSTLRLFRDKKTRALILVPTRELAMQGAEAVHRYGEGKKVGVVAVYGGARPDSHIRIAPTWLVEMLHSIVLEDRIQAARALVLVTDSPNSGALDLIRERGIDSLKEMARWTTLRYALPPFLLLGRVAGIADSEIHAQWETGDRESVIQKALALEPGKHVHP